MPVISKDLHLRKGNVNEDRYTYSMISTYLNCPHQFELKYIIGVKRDLITQSLVEGICHHDAMDEDNKTKFKRLKSLSVKTHFECFADGYKKEKKYIDINDSGVKEDKVISRGKAMIKNYKLSNFSKMIPDQDDNGKAFIERYFEFPITIDGSIYIIQGFVDLLAFNPFDRYLFDYKITNQAKYQGFVNNSLQLCIYKIGMMKYHIVNKCHSGIISLVKKNAKVDIKIASFSFYKLRWALKVVESVIKSIKTGIFPYCSPDNPLCSPKYCGVWNECKR